MERTNSTVWIKILWSVVILFALSLWIYRTNGSSNGILGIEIVPYIFSPIVLAVTIVVVLLQMWNKMDKRAFFYILVAVSNLYVGSLGIYFNLASQIRVFSIIDLVFICNIACAIVFLKNMFTYRV
jgi:hypothetical protein